MTSLQRIGELKVDAHYHRQRLDLYRAKVYGPRPTSHSRLKELERASVLSASLLRRAEQELDAATARPHALAESANLALVRSIYAAWSLGDYSSVEWAHPDIEFVIADGPEPGSWKGIANMAETWRSFVSTWEDWRVEVDESRELDDERVLVLLHNSGRGKTRGLKVGFGRTRSANLFHIRSGKVTRLVIYFNSQRALADLGLATGARSPLS